MPRFAPLLVFLSACGTLNTARPLDPGQHEVGATLGGGMILLGGAPIPQPNIVVEARSGVAKPLDRPLDVNYGLNLTALPYGAFQTHVGVSWMLAKPKGGIPAVSSASRFWFATNALGVGYKTDKTVRAWGAYQLEVDVSWLVKEQLIYVGLAQYTDFANPTLTLSPAVGFTFDTDPKKPGGPKIHLEARWFGINGYTYLDTVRFVGNGRGIFGLTLGVSYVIDPRRKQGRGAPPSPTEEVVP